MSEKKPKVTSVIESTERQRQKSNESKRTGLDATSDGLLLYPEEQIKITAQQALELAQNIVREYGLDSEEERIKQGKLNFGLNRDVLAAQREYARFASNVSLLGTLSFHKEHPKYYATELILAAAEALIRRFSP
ncbi:hypothetical protein HY415_01425 [Candidatus Kaiserbacteria bacterium]|nr:hypothetical protein [Candidatus Kaiserbacteria bacterium]